MYQVGAKKEKQPPKYQNYGAFYWTVTDEGFAYFYEARKQAAREIQELLQLQKAETVTEMKKLYGQQVKIAKKWEKAANIWINKFTKGAEISNFPLELEEQLNTIFWKAENAHEA